MFEQRAEERVESERIGILGGTFDPVHYAHLAVAEEVYHALKLTRVLFVPAAQPPHKREQRITPIQHRIAMLKLAISDNPHFALSLVDAQREGPAYTVDTLRLLRAEWGTRAEFYFVLGGDSLKDLPTWHDPAGILEQAMLVALTRPGYIDVSAERAELVARLPALEKRLITLEGPRLDISSTELRQRIVERRPIRYQTPDAVVEYISQRAIYRRLSSPAWPLPEGRTGI